MRNDHLRRFVLWVVNSDFIYDAVCAECEYPWGPGSEYARRSKAWMKFRRNTNPAPERRSGFALKSPKCKRI